MTTPTEADMFELRNRVNSLLLEAIENGMTFTVDEIPLMPPRMGGKIPRVIVHAMTPTYQQQLAHYMEHGDA